MTEEKNCVFCTHPDIRERTIVENDFAFAFPTNIPITDGHTLVTPKRCVARLSELTNEEWMALRELTIIIMDVLKKAHGAEGFNCAWNQEKLAGQSVPHIHLHIIPRKEGDSGLLGFDPRTMIYQTQGRPVIAEDELARRSEFLKAFMNR